MVGAIQFDFSPSQRIIFGSGTARQAGELARQLAKRPLLIRGCRREWALPVVESLESARLDWIELEICSEPDIGWVQQAVEQARQEGCDEVIGCGGGSAIDCAKAVAALLTNTGSLMDYLEVVGKALPLANPAAPVIAVPTTAGTGSEVTRNAVLFVPDEQVKVSLRSPFMLPRVALVDPELTYSLPPEVTAATGMDALTQVLEPFVSNRANAMTDLFCREGLRLAGRSLLTAFANGSDARAREEMAFTSLLGGLSLANAGLGAVHGFAAPIGGMFAAPHGAVCAALLPETVRANISALARRQPESPILQRYDEVGRLLTNDPQAGREHAWKFLQELLASLQIPGLRSYGISNTDFDEILARAKVSSSMKGNPIRLTDEELEQILARSL